MRAFTWGALLAHTRKKSKLELRTAGGDHRPVRRCAWTRESHPKDELLRLVLDPSDRVFVDVLGRAPGRGIYVLPSAPVVAAALSSKGLQRLFRGRARGLGFAPDAPSEPADSSKLSAPLGSPSDHIARLLLIRATELIALARRAGQLEVGTETVQEQLKKNLAGSVLVLARDLSPRSERSAREAWLEANQVRLRVFGTKDHFGEVLGRSPTGILYCLPGSIADRIAAEGRRLAGIQGLNEPSSGVQNDPSPNGAPRQSNEGTRWAVGVRCSD